MQSAQVLAFGGTTGFLLAFLFIGTAINSLTYLYKIVLRSSIST